jgi:hypothetical protein
MEAEDVLDDIVAQSYPIAEDVGAGWLRRDWVVRTAVPLPEEEALRALGARLGDDVFASILDAYGELVSRERLESARPEYRLIRVDERHLVVRMKFAGHERSMGDEAAISQIGFLQRLDRALRIDDLQGLPRALWFFLRMQSEESGGS